MYIIQIMSGQKFTVNKSEYEAIMKAEKGIFIPRLESFINKSSISAAYPESNADEVEKRKDQQVGVLHDGTRVKRYFGEWVVAETQVPDDNGNYRPVKLDPKYYPEVARDCVPTIEEYQKIAYLPTAEKKELILKGTNQPRELVGGFTAISKIL